MASDLPFSLQTLKEHDPERYLACLYLPEPIRVDVANIWAFDVEIARIPHLVSEPMPGEIRIQWWRDLIKSGDNANSGPLAHALMETINRHNLPRDNFDNYLEARIFDLYNDPMPDKAALEGYLGETVSLPMQLAAVCAGAERSTELADACGHAGMAIGLARLLSIAGWHRSKRQLHFPAESLRSHELSPETWFDTAVTDAHVEVVRDIVKLAEHHLEQAEGHVSVLPNDVRSVFLMLALVRPKLRKIRGAGAKLFQEKVALSLVQIHWNLLKRALLGG